MAGFIKKVWAVTSLLLIAIAMTMVFILYLVVTPFTSGVDGKDHDLTPM